MIAIYTFGLANLGRRGLESLLPIFSAVNTTGIPLAETTVQLITDILGGVLVGLPGK